MRSATRRLWLCLALFGSLTVVATPAEAAGPIVASAPGTVVCTNGPTFDLIAKAGRIQTPDGNSVYMWGYAQDDADDTFQMPGPILCVNEGDTVTVNLTNRLANPTSIVFPGQSGVTATGGSPGLLAQEAASGGGTVSYTFTASRPGTYIYESGTEPSKQVEMGLYGALIVRPAMGPNFAYNDASTEFDPAREYLIILHDIDPDLHHAVNRGQAYDVTKKHDRYWTVNGRSFPDSIADSGVEWLPNQPYGALVWVEIDSPLPALVRYANAGLSNHPFHPHGNHLRVVARDGDLLEGPGGQDGSMESFTKTIGSGQTYDMLFRFEDDEGYSPSNPVRFEGTEVVFPGLLNEVFKDDYSFYSGSPYLGEQDELPPAVTRLNECGEFYYPWHSHALNEFQNFDEGFGGLATLLRVDPVDGCPPDGEPPLNTAPPTITSQAAEGQTLTATDGTWTGTPTITFARQWQRLSGSTWVDIAGATSSTYTLTGADVGLQVRVRVTATNDFGTAEAFSAASATVISTLRLSFTESDTIGGVGFANEDIVSYSGTSFAMLFDGSDVLGGINAALLDLDAFAFLDADSILMSFQFPAVIPGISGVTDDSDVVRFNATSLGTTTAGAFSLYFDGSDVGLTETAEDVDAIQRLGDTPSSPLILSTEGNPDVPGVSGEADEDLLRFTPTSIGSSTAGTYAMHFDGSDVGLTTGDEGVDSAWTANNGDIYLSTTGAFSVTGASGANEDVFVFRPTSLGTTTAGTFSSTLQFDGSTFGQGGNDVDGAGRRNDAGISAATVKRAQAPKVAVSAKKSTRRVTFRAQVARCAPCKVTLRMKARGVSRSLAMRRVGRAYVAVARAPKGRLAYYAVARDLDSGRRTSSAVRRLSIGPAALVTFNLCADEDSTTLPGTGSVPIWGFSQDTGLGCGPAQLPGPQLTVTEGDVVTVNLTNNLDTESVSLVFPGQTLAPDTVGAAPMGGTATYTFTATNPGAYLYESGVNTEIQLPMGLYGALVVRPALGAGYAYNDLSTQFDVERVLVLSEIDTNLNAAPGTFDPLDWDPDYWLMNGQAHPDIPDIAAAAGNRVALRYLNAGQDHHTMMLLGQRQRIIARDSFHPDPLMQPLVMPDVMAETIPTGSGTDAIVDLTGAAAGARYPLYSRQLAITNGPAYPGGMLGFITVAP